MADAWPFLLNSLRPQLRSTLQVKLSYAPFSVLMIGMQRPPSSLELRGYGATSSASKTEIAPRSPSAARVEGCAPSQAANQQPLPRPGKNARCVKVATSEATPSRQNAHFRKRDHLTVSPPRQRVTLEKLYPQRRPSSGTPLQSVRYFRELNQGAQKPSPSCLAEYTIFLMRQLRGHSAIRSQTQFTLCGLRARTPRRAVLSLPLPLLSALHCGFVLLRHGRQEPLPGSEEISKVCSHASPSTHASS